MKKNMVYLVDGVEEVGTLKELSEMLGQKITKKAVLNGEVEGVQYVESQLEEVAADTESTEDDALVNDIESALEEDVDVKEVDEDATEDMDSNEGTEEEVVEDTTEDTVEDTQEVATEEDTTKDTVEEVTEDAKPKKIDTSKMTLQEKLALITKPAQPKAKAKAEKYPVDKEIDFPEVGHFKTKDELKEFYKPLQDSHLDQWIELEGLTWKESGNAGIDRMRRCMAISALHFPSTSKSKKSKSKYAQYSTEQLVEMCLDNDLEVADGKGDARILRMYCIMALRKHGVIE